LRLAKGRERGEREDSDFNFFVPLDEVHQVQHLASPAWS